MTATVYILSVFLVDSSTALQVTAHGACELALFPICLIYLSFGCNGRPFLGLLDQLGKQL